MKLLILTGNDYRLEMERRDSYGFAFTYWKRPMAAWWQVGCRISLLFGKWRPFVRITTYSCIKCASGREVVMPMDCVIEPHLVKPKFE